jgi:hypothetical protein
MTSDSLLPAPGACRASRPRARPSARGPDDAVQRDVVLGRARQLGQRLGPASRRVPAGRRGASSRAASAARPAPPSPGGTRLPGSELLPGAARRKTAHAPVAAGRARRRGSGSRSNRCCRGGAERACEWERGLPLEAQRPSLGARAPGNLGAARSAVPTAGGRRHVAAQTPSIVPCVPACSRQRWSSSASAAAAAAAASSCTRTRPARPRHRARREAARAARSGARSEPAARALGAAGGLPGDRRDRGPGGGARGARGGRHRGRGARALRSPVRAGRPAQAGQPGGLPVPAPVRAS